MIIVLAMALTAMAVIRFMHFELGACVVVILDRKEIGRYPLEKDGVYDLTGYEEGWKESELDGAAK